MKAFKVLRSDRNSFNKFLFRSTILLFFLYCLIGAEASAQDGWTTPINISNTTRDIQAHTSAVDNEGNIYLVWSEGVIFTKCILKLSKSVDGGITWSNPENISDTNGIYSYPSLAIDSKGVLHVFYLDNNGYTGKYITSDNVWANPIDVTGLGGHWPQLVIDKQDTKYFFWGSTEIRYRSLTENTWSETMVISDSSAHSGIPKIEVDKEDNLHVIYEVIRLDTFKLYYRKKTAEGWDKLELITQISTHMQEYSITLLNGSPFFVWDEAVINPTVRYIFWKDGILGSRPIPVNYISISVIPSACTDKNGVVHLVWYKYDYGHNESGTLFYSYFKNNQWSEADSIPFNLPVPVTVPRVLTYNDRLFLSFTSDHRANVYFSSRSILSDASEQITDKVNETNLQVYPNPFNSEAAVKYNLNKSGRVTIKLYDILGKEVTLITNEEKSPGEYKINLDAKQLSSGIYFLRLTIENEFITKKLVIIK